MKNFMAGSICAVILALPAFADTLKVELATYEVISTVEEDGSVVETRVAPSSIVPQDRIVVIASLENSGAEVLTSVTFVLDINKALTVDLESIVAPENIGLNFSTIQEPTEFGLFEDLIMLEEDGTSRAAVPEDLAAMQVAIAEMEPAKTQMLEYSATVR